MPEQGKKKKKESSRICGVSLQMKM